MRNSWTVFRRIYSFSGTNWKSLNKKTENCKTNSNNSKITFNLAYKTFILPLT